MTRPHARPQMTQRKAEHALAQLLLNCRTEKLVEFTAESLSASYKVALPRCAEMLAGEKLRRRV